MTHPLHWRPTALSTFDARSLACAHVEHIAQPSERPDAAKPWRWSVVPPSPVLQTTHGWSPTMDAAKSAARRALAALPEHKP